MNGNKPKTCPACGNRLHFGVLRCPCCHAGSQEGFSSDLFQMLAYLRKEVL